MHGMYLKAIQSMKVAVYAGQQSSTPSTRIGSSDRLARIQANSCNVSLQGRRARLDVPEICMTTS